MKIILPCKTTDDLRWKSILEPLSPVDRVLWEFDLGINAPYFPIEDEMKFSSLKLSLAQFSKEVWPLFSERSMGAVLYRGSADFASFFLWSELQEENWLSWKKMRPDANEAHLRRLFCADVFAHYFQMLSHSLPDELPLTLCFETQGCGTLAEKRQLLSRERFEHFHLVTEVSDASFAVCMPEEGRCSEAVLAKLDHFFETCSLPYRVIEEAFLTESWEGVDLLYVISEAVTTQGKRKLMGFCAAGGKVIVDGVSLGLSNEVSAEKFGAEGFEPPAYWSQTSRASQTALCPERPIRSK